MGWLSDRLPAGFGLACLGRASLPVPLPWCGSKEARASRPWK